jgi:hypothetical protein
VATADEVTMETANTIVTKSQKHAPCMNMPKRNDPVEAIKKAISTKLDDGQRKDVLLWINLTYGDLANAL